MESTDHLADGIACYRSGRYDEAYAAFQASEAEGNKKAPRYIGQMYEEGLGLPRDCGEAAACYARGVAMGDLTSGYRLGLLYRDGRGVPRDLQKAAALFASVAASDNKAATGVLDAERELALLRAAGICPESGARP